MNIHPPLTRNGFLMAITTRLLLLSAMFGFGLPGSILRAESAVEEYDVKAAFLANFAQFVKWPGGGSGTTLFIPN